jgi:hypothetical protein
MHKFYLTTKVTKVHKGKAHKGKKLAIVLLSLILLLTACQTAPTLSSTPAETSTPLPTETATVPFSPTQIPTVTPTAEPAWFQPLDPSMGTLKYQYAEVINKQAKVYASLEDAVGKTGNYGHLPKSPAYVAYTTTERRDGKSFYFLPVNYGWMNGEDLQLLTPSTFTGILLTREVSFRFGWVLAETQSVNSAGMPVQAFNGQREARLHRDWRR